MEPGSDSFQYVTLFIPLPDEGENLAAGACLTRLTVRHQSLRRAEDRHSESVANARDLSDADVLAEAWRGNTLQLANDRLSALRVLEYDAKRLAAALFLESAIVL